MEVTFCSAIDEPWWAVPPIVLGAPPVTLPAADRYVTVAVDGSPILRLDLYQSEPESHLFEDAKHWRDKIAVGWGHSVFVVDLVKRTAVAHKLGNYFGYLHLHGDRLLVCSAERIFAIAYDGKLIWKSDRVGIDGVVLRGISDGVVRGEGEWDPPNGWRAFAVGLDNGRSL